MCSSDNDFQQEEREKDKKKRRGKKMIDKTLKERRSSKTLTEQDIKHIERHLSMKRTIRKKIMRDLQSTFVLGPTDYIMPLPCQKDNVEKLGYSSESNILDMLRDSQDSGHDSPHRWEWEEVAGLYNNWDLLSAKTENLRAVELSEEEGNLVILTARARS